MEASGGSRCSLGPLRDGAPADVKAEFGWLVSREGDAAERDQGSKKRPFCLAW